MSKLAALTGKIKWRDIRLQWRACAACGASVFAKLFDDETGVRCLRCGATPIHLAIVEVLQKLLSHRNVSCAYEMSSRGALLKYLQKNIPTVVSSEYLEDVEPGTCRDGVRCEDVQRLSFADGQFDLCTSTEVFEHVANDRQGFAEVFRVLKPNGTFVFTVPLSASAVTFERAAEVDGSITHLLPPAYHGDRLRGEGKVLVFRDYGMDVADRLRYAGFRRAEVLEEANRYFGFTRRAIVATK